MHKIEKGWYWKKVVSTFSKKKTQKKTTKKNQGETDGRKVYDVLLQKAKYSTITRNYWTRHMLGAFHYYSPFSFLAMHPSNLQRNVTKVHKFKTATLKYST